MANFGSPLESYNSLTHGVVVGPQVQRNSLRGGAPPTPQEPPGPKKSPPPPPLKNPDSLAHGAVVGPPWSKGVRDGGSENVPNMGARYDLHGATTCPHSQRQL